MSKQLKNILLNINSGYTFFVSSIHMGLMISLVMFWYPSWDGITLDTIQNSFSVPALLATKLFLVLIPIMMFTSLIMIVTEWKTPLKWPAIAVFVFILGSIIVTKYLIFPINEIIYAGINTNEELKEHVQNWMVQNNKRVFFSVLTWWAMFAFYTMKSYRKS